MCHNNGMDQTDIKQQEEVARSSLNQLVLKAAFIAAVSFGGPAGVLAAFFPRAFFELTAFAACPGSSVMTIDQWYDGETNQVRMVCTDPVLGEVSERTLLALLVWMGINFLAAFYITLTVLLLRRAYLRRKYGVEG